VKESRIGYLGDPNLPSELQRQQLDLIQARNRMDQETALICTESAIRKQTISEENV
jgi:hypothetical protein